VRYTAVSVGQQVLYNSHRTGSQKYYVEDSYLAEVLETGVRYSYEVRPSGWSYSPIEDRETEHGIRLRVQPHVPGDSWETTTIAAYLVPAEGEALAKWQARQRSNAEHRADMAFHASRLETIQERFSDAGVDVKLIRGFGVSLRLDAAEQVLAMLASTRDNG
jgi:hypothetical protein